MFHTLHPIYSHTYKQTHACVGDIHADTHANGKDPSPLQLHYLLLFPPNPRHSPPFPAEKICLFMLFISFYVSFTCSSPISRFHFTKSAFSDRLSWGWRRRCDSQLFFSGSQTGHRDPDYDSEPGFRQKSFGYVAYIYFGKGGRQIDWVMMCSDVSFTIYVRIRIVRG